MRCSLLAVLGLAVALSTGQAHASNKAPETRDARVGQMFMLKFPGNRAAGYRWRLNEEKSKGLELVDVDQIAWTIPNEKKGPRSMFFKNPSVLSFRVMPKAVGEANLAFDYFRMWGNKNYVKTQVVRVTIVQ